MTRGPILVGVDFEEGSRRALELAKELGRALGDEVAIIHVYTLPIYTYPGLDPVAVPPLVTDVTDAARRAIEEFAAQEGVQRALLREGDVATEIIAAAHEIGAQMIAVGTHARGAIAHALLGSVAERVVRRSPIPVLTVRVSRPSAGEK